MRFIHLLFLSLLITCIHGQVSERIAITPNDNGKKVAQLLREIEDSHEVDFIFDNLDVLEVYSVTGVTEGINFYDYLERLIQPLNLTFVKKGPIILILSIDLYENYGNRKDNFIILPIDENGNKPKIQGVVYDANNEPLVGAQVLIKSLNVGDVADINGEYSFNVKKGIYELNCSFIGFESRSYVVAFSSMASSASIKINLPTASRELDAVVVEANRIDNIKSNVSGVNVMSIKTVKEIPAFMGEVDVIKSLTTLPGVSTPGELSSGFNVRGGGAGQNLVMQDEAIIYNPTHLFGFFSSFNPDMVSNVELYKGGGSAKFGGRTSSILNVSLRNGDAGKFKLNGGIGLVSSRLTAEGPIKKYKSSYLVGSRVSYVNWMIKGLENADLEGSNASFYDLTFKTLFTIDRNNTISASAYTSFDSFRLNDDSKFYWRTKNASFKWDHIYSQTLSSELSLSYSNYENVVIDEDEVDGFEYVNSIFNTRLNYDFIYMFSENMETSLGTDIIYSEIEPGRINPNGLGENVIPIDINNQYSLEAAIYLNNDITLSKKVSLSAGLRFSNFWRVGEDNVYEFDQQDFDGRYPSIKDSTYYEPGEIIQYRNGLEPRISLRYLIRPDLSLKGSYYLTYQYLHLISNSVSVSPQDYWIASGPHLQPQWSTQWSMGLFKDFNESQFELSIEGFYRKVYNSVDYIEGADNVLNKSFEAGLIQGNGRAYGSELMLKKSNGVISGWLSYTYSRSLMKFNSELDYKTINNGDYYPSAFDQPHNLSLVCNLKLTKLITFTTNFSYSTGRPITIPIDKVSYENYLSALSYSQRNSYRIPDYHRLDISFKMKEKPGKNKRIDGEWIIGLYNLYGRKNAYSVYFSEQGNAFKVSVLGSIFPYVNYNFKI